MPKGTFQAALEQWYKNNPEGLEDVTQLLSLKEYEKFKNQVFPVPPDATVKNSGDKKHQVTLTDLFTVFTDTLELNPVMLSVSMRSLLGLSTDMKLGAKSGSESTQDAEKLVKSLQGAVSWDKQWDPLLSTLMGKKFESLPPEIRNFFASNFAETTFCVISYGTVGTVTQKICAIVEKDTRGQNSFDRYVIKRLYWL